MQPLISERIVEMDAALLQSMVTLTLGLLGVLLYRRYRKPYLGWFAVAWFAYLLRLAAVVLYLWHQSDVWMYFLQAFTGWTALALLWAAMVFARGSPGSPRMLLLWLFPGVWAFVAVFVIDNFLLAALPAVAFLSVVTCGAGGVFLSYYRRVRSMGAALLGVALVVWGLHHLDYPILRATGGWAPWGYYIDIMAMLGTGVGIVVLLLDDLRRGLTALLDLSRDLQGGVDDNDVVRLLERTMSLPAATGSALFAVRNEAVELLRGAGVCASWPSHFSRFEAGVLSGGVTRVMDNWHAPASAEWRVFAFAAVLPVPVTEGDPVVLLIVGDARNPFAALDADFLTALAQQVGAALDHGILYRRLAARTADLERLSVRMVRQTELERRRLSLHLHDETAQLLTATRFQLGMLEEEADPRARQRIARALELMDDGLRSIRNVTDSLRPSLLDDLGLVPALRSLVAQYGMQGPLTVTLEAPERPLPLSAEAELTLFRALQESLSNVVAHAGATSATVRLAIRGEEVTLAVSDDGCGFPAEEPPLGLERSGHLGLVGMRERVAALGGSFETGAADGGGAVVTIALPLLT